MLLILGVVGGKISIVKTVLEESQEALTLVTKSAVSCWHKCH